MSDFRRIFRKLKEAPMYVSLILRRARWKVNLKQIEQIKVHDHFQFQFVKYGDVTRLLYTREAFIQNKTSFEYYSLEKFIKLIETYKNLSVMDIGGNIGLYSLIANSLPEVEHVYCFEPDVETFNVLEKNLLLNNCKKVKAFNIGFSDEKGYAELRKPENMEATQGDSLNYLDFNNNDSKKSRIKLDTIDDFLKSNSIKKVDLLKIDIEGAELLCLKGAEQLLRSEDRPIIFMECADELADRFRYSVFDVLKYLDRFGYKFEQFEYNMWLAIPS